jgi:hypothetical protein
MDMRSKADPTLRKKRQFLDNVNGCNNEEKGYTSNYKYITNYLKM